MEAQTGMDIFHPKILIISKKVQKVNTSPIGSQRKPFPLSAFFLYLPFYTVHTPIQRKFLGCLNSKIAFAHFDHAFKGISVIPLPPLHYVVYGLAHNVLDRIDAVSPCSKILFWLYLIVISPCTKS